ncbi:integral membrane metal-binding protein [Vairimorpha apis BRL 01]|uniref:Endoplasmic reticulum junction formation protein lunapark n=1 Tax=Vairimorpha apis BRL 01 TaxID=1037528 RepID=T0L2T9_9MICR|nr:integral membrane metal-binding protein [Vairimorpha apis BRL 01]
MGNIVSKKKLQEKKSHLKHQKYLYVFSIFSIILSLIYAYIDNQNILIFLVLPFLITIVVNFLFSTIYDWRIENVIKKLEELKETQKENVEKLKKEEDFTQTVELLEKYDENTLRDTSFSRIQQKKKNVMDTVTNIVLGEDPSLKYALICKECLYHNGMIDQNDDLNGFVCYNCNAKNDRRNNRKK